MERFCGSIQPAIKNRCYSYASMSKHVTDEARLTQVQLLYNLQDELSFRANPHPRQCFVHSNCTWHVQCVNPIAIWHTDILKTLHYRPDVHTPPTPNGNRS